MNYRTVVLALFALVLSGCCASRMQDANLGNPCEGARLFTRGTMPIRIDGQRVSAHTASMVLPAGKHTISTDFGPCRCKNCPQSGTPFVVAACRDYEVTTNNNNGGTVGVVDMLTGTLATSYGHGSGCCGSH